MKKTAIIIISVLFVLTASWVLADDARKKKVLHVNSYHAGYDWSDGITDAILKEFGIQKDKGGNLDASGSVVELKIVEMDTKRNASEEFKKTAALKVKKVIDTWKPDLVIAADDNASKYLIVPYFKDADLPFVFCGVNWDATPYGYPFKNTTGMVEVALLHELIKELKVHSKGTRVGFLAADVTTTRKELDFYRKNLSINFEQVKFVKDSAEWKTAYLALQKSVDVLIIPDWRGVSGWNKTEVLSFVQKHTEIPSGTLSEYMANYCLASYAKDPTEQGEWAAKTALEILAGKEPLDIPLAVNKRAKIILNMKLAKKLGVKFSMELIENADLISAEQKKVFFINSYHKGYVWSDDIEMGLLKALDIRENPDGTYDTSGSDIELKVFRMDTKLNQSEAFKKRAALSAKAIIDEWKPDIVVASDDNAAKYLIAPYYKNTAIPFVFCGLNWDASIYGFPVSNVTGMVEIEPVLETIEMLKKYANGDRIGFIGVKGISNQKSIDNYVNRLGIKFADGKLVSVFSEWKKEYLRLQDTVDMILWLNPVGIAGWDRELAEKFILENTIIPTGATGDHNKRFALVGIVKIAEEQGWWSGKRALEILNGKSPEDIPVITNKKSRVYLNMELAKRMGIKFPMELIEKSTFLENPRD